MHKLGKRVKPFQRRRLRVLCELGLLFVALISALGLASLAGKKAEQPPLLVLPCLVGLAFGIGVTFYITPNVYALDFGGEDCASSSAILDTTGLVVSSL